MPRAKFAVLAVAGVLAACSRKAPEPMRLELLASVGAGLGGDFPGGDAGPPCAVAADAGAVFLGWQGARAGHEIVACEPGGRALWGHHHGPGVSGVRSLAADAGVVFVLADADGRRLYRLDAKTGAPLPWEGRADADLPITALWGSGDDGRIDRATSIAAGNGRLYVVFEEEGFIAALDGKSGAYLTTLTAQRPRQMFACTTPMRDPETGVERPIDFGIATFAGNGIAYFLMEHEPPWVMASTTRWLAEGEQISALTVVGDAMKSAKLVIFTAEGALRHLVRARPVDAVEGFSTAIGVRAGRTGPGPWNPGAMRDIRALAVDATGQLWVAEGDGIFGRFTVWTTGGRDGTLVREIIGPLDPATLHIAPGDPPDITLGGLRWRLGKKAARCIEQPAIPPSPTALLPDLRDAEGRVLWAPPAGSTGEWGVHRAGDGTAYAIRRGAGVEIFVLRAP